MLVAWAVPHSATCGAHSDKVLGDFTPSDDISVYSALNELGVDGLRQAKVLHTLVERITVRKDDITIKWLDKGLNKLLRDTLEPRKEQAAA